MNLSPEVNSCQSIRKSLGIPTAALVALVLYDQQCEQAWRANAQAILEKYHYLLVLPLTEIARRIYQATSLGLSDRAILIDSIDMESACDELVAFRVIEDVLIGRKIPVRILDTNNRWLSQELSYGMSES